MPTVKPSASAWQTVTRGKGKNKRTIKYRIVRKRQRVKDGTSDGTK